MVVHGAQAQTLPQSSQIEVLLGSQSNCRSIWRPCLSGRCTVQRVWWNMLRICEAADGRFHLARNRVILLTAAEMANKSAGVQKRRLHFKQRAFEGERMPAMSIRATNGHASPGVYCPKSLFAEVLLFDKEGDPQFFTHLGLTATTSRTFSRKVLHA